MSSARTFGRNETPIPVGSSTSLGIGAAHFTPSPTITVPPRMEMAVAQRTLRKLRRRNFRAPISRLPTELLCEIFKALMEKPPPNSESYYTFNGRSITRSNLQWLVVTRICSSWRQIALGYSELWTSVDCDNISMALTFIKRSRGSLIDVWIGQAVSNKALRRALRTRVHEIHRLIVYAQQWEKIGWLIGTTSALYLEDMSLCTTRPSRLRDTPFGNNFPNLVSLTLTSLSVPWGPLRCSNLRKLSIEIGDANQAPNVAQVVMMLATTPKLERFLITRLHPNSNHADAAVPTIDLCHLQEAVLTVHPSPSERRGIVRALLSHLILPANVLIRLRAENCRMSEIGAVLPRHMQPPALSKYCIVDLFSASNVRIQFGNKLKKASVPYDSMSTLGSGLEVEGCRLLLSGSINDVPSRRQSLGMVLSIMENARGRMVEQSDTLYFYRSDTFVADKTSEFDIWQDIFGKLHGLRTLIAMSSNHQGIMHVIRMLRAVGEPPQSQGDAVWHALPNLSRLELSHGHFSYFYFTFPLKDFLTKRVQSGHKIQELVVRNCTGLSNSANEGLDDLVDKVVLDGAVVGPFRNVVWN